ncbi:MAG TPA: LPXTG cell wall anchor domain-containing protein [Terracidiphilus sp.]|nr:LPXTG cell wall anchor domain-containing protein [Terracidiphilus sp.]
MNEHNGWMRAARVFAVGAIGLAVTIAVNAQVQTAQQEQKGQATKTVKVENAQVLSVDGNDLILKMDDGTIRHLANLPESSRVTVDGKELGIHDLKPGMHLQKTVTTTTTPKVIVTTQSVTGKVFHVNAPLTVILTMDNGENQSFKVPNGQKFVVNGQETDVFGLKKGMIVTATKVVEEPVTQVEHEAKLTGKMPPPPPPPPADVPILVAVVTPVPPPPAAPAAAPAELPKTGSDLPLTGLVGLMLLAGSAGIRVFQRFRTSNPIAS